MLQSEPILGESLVIKIKALGAGIVLSACLLASGCNPYYYHPQARPSKITKGAVYGATTGAISGGLTSEIGGPAGALIGGVAGGLIGFDHYLRQTPKERMLTYFQMEGITLVEQGEQVRLILPADKIFYQGAPRIKWLARPLVEDVSKFLRMYHADAVEVKGYTDSRGAPIRNLALSRERAETLAYYLWRHGLHTRMVFAEGYGDNDPIASNRTEGGRQMNRRIEIVFQRIVT